MIRPQTVRITRWTIIIPFAAAISIPITKRIIDIIPKRKPPLTCLLLFFPPVAEEPRVKFKKEQIRLSTAAVIARASEVPEAVILDIKTRTVVTTAAAAPMIINIPEIL